jgi:uncharacterized protein YgbK (DUF1537 family)
MGTMGRIAIIADDLTGAMDSGVQLAKRGVRTVVRLLSGEQYAAEAVVVSTDSRDKPAREAYRRARQVAKPLTGCALYKKLDSTLRGNLGAELDGVLDGTGLDRALVAPAFPSAGRTTSDGYHRVFDALLAETSFANDPLWPATESHLPTILARQTCRAVSHLSLSVVDRGERAVRQALLGEASPIVTADATEDRHLRVLATALTGLPGQWLPCGSAGLAEAWAASLGLRGLAEGPSTWAADSRPVLVVSGSRHEATATQLKRAATSSGLRLISLGADEADDLGRVKSEAEALLRNAENVALTTTFSPYREGRAEAAAEMLAGVAKSMLTQLPVSGIVVTGGDTALALCRALGVTALRPLGEIQPGIPAAAFVGGMYANLRVVSKAGGFGDEWAIAQSIDSIQGRQT